MSSRELLREGDSSVCITRGALAVTDRTEGAPGLLGSDRPYSSSPSAIRTPDGGRLIGAVNMLVDISERKQSRRHRKPVLLRYGESSG